LRIGTVNFVYVKGYAGNNGNEQADKLAKEGSLKEAIKFNEILKKGEIYEYKILKLLRTNAIKCYAHRLYYEINNKKKFIGDGGIDLTRNYNEVFFAIQAKYRKDHHNEQAEDIKKFDKALELQSREVVGFFITTIDFSTESKEAALNSKRKIFL
ncbi:10060_t:CDS:2, partial [Scutellospora calospora]